MKKILVIGAYGQVGTELVLALRKKYGDSQVIASGIHKEASVVLDAMDKEAILFIVKKENVGEIYHLAALLSSSGEKDPKRCWELNMGSLRNVLDVGVEHKLKIFWPSSIAAFGPTTPKESTPQHTIIEPTTMYGVTKYAGELLCQYYYKKFSVDVRSIRYPGLISGSDEPSGGTTDYAVAIFHGALKEGKYTCYLSENTYLPMMYMDDAIRATISLMEAPAEKLKTRMSYNLSAISFSPKEIAAEIKKHVPDFKISYAPDHRQAIADSWPSSIDDSEARRDWGWQHEYDLPKMTEVVLKNLKKN
ncbi:MAG: NAD-dependent epimerase/dehydratase family protein [Patescibacteria group bacterium]